MTNEPSALAAFVDGAPLAEDAARDLWKRFSEHMGEHKGDIVGFAKTNGFVRVTPSIAAAARCSSHTRRSPRRHLRRAAEAEAEALAEADAARRVGGDSPGPRPGALSTPWTPDQGQCPWTLRRNCAMRSSQQAWARLAAGLPAKTAAATCSLGGVVPFDGALARCRPRSWARQVRVRGRTAPVGCRGDAPSLLLLVPDVDLGALLRAVEQQDQRQRAHDEQGGDSERIAEGDHRSSGGSRCGRAG